MRDVLELSGYLAAKEMENPPALPELLSGPPSPDKDENGGRFDFDDGGTFCGGWEDGKAHGHGVCTGPKAQGEYSGSWHYGFEVSGVYTWPSGSTFDGHWQNGKRHGLGVETRGRWMYRGEWTQGYKGRYGVRQSSTSNAKYEGTWASGLQDGYGSETYADGGTFQGQWLRGLRHGIGVRTSAPYGTASFYRSKVARASMTSLRSEHAPDAEVAGAAAAAEAGKKVDDSRGGFVLKAKSDEPPVRRSSLAERSTNLKKSILHGLRIKKQRSTGDIDKRGAGSIRSTGSGTSWASNESSHSGITNNSRHTDSNVSFVSQDDMIDPSVIETYMGEWKNDKRCGFGVSERSDGLKYQGEWYNNKKYGYGVTSLKDGTREEGKYKNNMLITSNKKKHIFLIRSAKFRERVDSAVNAAIRASQLALQKADIAISRTATARGKAEQADIAQRHAREDSELARKCGKQFAPEFEQPGVDILKRRPMEGRSPFHPISRSRDVHPYFSNPLYNRKDDMNSSNPSFSGLNSSVGEDDHPSPGGLRMSIDYGNTRDTPRGQSDHMPTVEDALMMQHSRLNNYSYLDPSAYSEQMGMHVTSNGGTANYTIQSSDSFSLRGSIRRGRNLSIREDKRPSGSRRYTEKQAMNDHFDQYRVEPSHLRSNSRSSSRAGSSTTAISALAFAQALRSRPPSVDTSHPNDSLNNQYGTDWTPDSGVSDGMDTDESPTRPSRRSTLPNLYNVESVASALNNHTSNDVGLHKRSGATPVPPDIPSPQRTASLYVNSTAKKNVGGGGGGVGGGGGGGSGGGGGGGVRAGTPAASALPKRKKSLPDIQLLPKQISCMSREEVSVLSSARRDEVRRQHDEAERYRANPLLYLVSPNMKDWISRQQLMMVVLFINISLAIMFFNLLT